MRIDLFAIWFMSGLMSRQLEQTPVFNAALRLNTTSNAAANLAASATATAAHSS